MKAYKIFKKDQKTGLFKPAQVPMRSLSVEGYETGVWYEAEDAQPKELKNRVGFHCARKPSVPHIKIIPGKVVWVEVEIDDYELINRPESQGGIWYLARFLKINRELDEDTRCKMISKEDYEREMK